MTDPILRRANESDIAGIVRCLEAAFPHNPKADEEVLRWQYWASPYGPPVSMVWDLDGEILGHYTNIRYGALLDGKPGTIGLGVDAALDPRLQGRGLFGPMARGLYEASGHESMPVTVCYPNRLSVKVIQRVGWKELGLLRTHLLVLDSAWLADRVHAPKFAVTVARAALWHRQLTFGVDAHEESGPSAELDNLWAHYGEHIRYGVRRDAAWFRWRYLERPQSAYRYYAAHTQGRLTGFAVTSQVMQSGVPFTYVLELITIDGKSARALARVISRESEASAALVVAALPGTRMSRDALAAGFRIVPARYEEKMLHFGVVDNVGGCPEIFEAPWELGWGDLDHL